MKPDPLVRLCLTSDLEGTNLDIDENEINIFDNN